MNPAGRSGPDRAKGLRSGRDGWRDIRQADALGGDQTRIRRTLCPPNSLNLYSAKNVSQIAAARGRVGDARAASRLFRASRNMASRKFRSVPIACFGGIPSCRHWHRIGTKNETDAIDRFDSVDQTLRVFLEAIFLAALPCHGRIQNCLPKLCLWCRMLNRSFQ